jgi:hypothetical protein
MRQDPTVLNDTRRITTIEKMLERFVISPSPRLIRGGTAKARMNTKMSEDSFEIGIQGDEDSIVIFIPFSEGSCTGHLNTGGHDDSDVAHPTTDNRDVDHVVGRPVGTEVGDTASVAGGGGGDPVITDPTVTDPRLDDEHFINLLELRDMSIGNDEFMRRCWGAMNKLRNIVRYRRFVPDFDEVISFGKHRNLPFHLLPLLYPSYCQYILTSGSSKSSSGFSKLARWLDMKFDAGAFDGF